MSRLVIGVLLILVTITAARAQDLASVEQQVETLRARLREVADKEAKLQERARQIEDELEPQNIERSVAGVGTTDARALRDERRQQLEREKANVTAQMQSLAASRASLEATIASAEAEAVRLRASALGASNNPSRAETQTNAPAPATPAVNKSRNTRRTSKHPRRARVRRRRP
jgi:chromosome segregation ATPase